MSRGYTLILLAAEDASETLRTHWLKHWLKTNLYRVKTSVPDVERRMAAASFFADIETIMEDLDQYEC